MRLTPEQLQKAHKTRLGRWNGSDWILAGSDVYRETPEGLRWEGSYAWFSVAAADRVSRGDTDKSMYTDPVLLDAWAVNDAAEGHAIDCDLDEDCACTP